MQKNRIRGPIITLAAVAALGGGLWTANASQQAEPAAATTPAIVTTVDNAPSPPPVPPKKPAPVQFPAVSAYHAAIETRTGVITVDITVNGDKGVAYVCDGNALEVWMSGSASDGVLALADRDARGRLSGTLRDTGGGPFVAGTLWIGERSWDFTAPAGVRP